MHLLKECKSQVVVGILVERLARHSHFLRSKFLQIWHLAESGSVHEHEHLVDGCLAMVDNRPFDKLYHRTEQGLGHSFHDEAVQFMTRIRALVNFIWCVEVFFIGHPHLQERVREAGEQWTCRDFHSCLGIFHFELVRILDELSLHPTYEIGMYDCTLWWIILVTQVLKRPMVQFHALTSDWL